MGKFIKGLLLFVIFNGVIIYLLEKKYEHYQNTYDLILGDLDKTKDSYTDIYIGNSHTEALQVYTNKPGAHVVNIATPGQDLFKAYSILKKWVPLMKNVQTIYLGLDYETLGQNLSLSGLAYEDRQLYKYTDTLYVNGLENLLMAKSNFFRSNRDVQFLFSKQKLPVSANYVPPVVKLNNEDCRKRALEHSQIRFKKELLDENINLLLVIIEIAVKNKRNLVIFNPPKSECFMGSSFKNNVLLAKGKIDSVFTKNNIKYYDFYNDGEFTKDDFLDYDHLNGQGTIKLITKINSLVFKK